MSGTADPIRLGIVGAGTMGAGIALLALRRGLETVLVDIDVEVLNNADSYIEGHLKKKDQGEEHRNLILSQEMGALAGCQVVIEAVPENLALKREILTQIETVSESETVIATNTSTLSITAIAAAATDPKRVGGMHFFNPAAVMLLVEVVRGAETTPRTLEVIQNLALSLGKTPVETLDSPGFIVNRVARPFYGEALRLVAEQVADFKSVDKIVQGAGFRMGPFRLMDLIGIDVNFSAMKSMYDQTFGEPRYRPHWLQQQMVDRGTLGKKSGRGFYNDYGSPGDEDAPDETRLKKPIGSLLISGGSWADGLRSLAKAGEIPLVDSLEANPAIVLVRVGRNEGLREMLEQYDKYLPEDVPILSQCVDVTLTEAANWITLPQRLVGFDGLFLARGESATLCQSGELDKNIRRKAEAVMLQLGRTPHWVQDSPALVLPRIIAALINEAAFAVGEGVASEETVDTAMKLGVNYPLGPFEWARALGLAKIITILDHLHSEYGEERYRVSAYLRRESRRV